MDRFTVYLCQRINRGGFNDYTSPFFDQPASAFRPRQLVVSLLDDEECFEACMSV